MTDYLNDIWEQVSDSLKKAQEDLLDSAFSGPGAAWKVSARNRLLKERIADWLEDMVRYQNYELHLPKGSATEGYVALKNTTGCDFRFFSVELKFYRESGSSTSVRAFTEDWANGERNRLRFPIPKGKYVNVALQYDTVHFEEARSSKRRPEILYNNPYSLKRTYRTMPKGPSPWASTVPKQANFPKIDPNSPFGPAPGYGGYQGAGAGSAIRSQESRDDDVAKSAASVADSTDIHPETEEPEIIQERELTEKERYLEAIYAWKEVTKGDAELLAKQDRLEYLTIRIFNGLEENPTEDKEARRFVEFFFPKMIRAITTYTDLTQQGIPGPEMAELKNQLETFVDGFNKACERTLRRIYMDDMADVSTDLSAMEKVLSDEGMIEEKK